MITMKNGLRLLPLVATLAGLAGCATAAKPEAMTVRAQNTAPFPRPFQNAMCVHAVSGGEKTNPLWISKVDNAGFQTALTASLSGAGLAAPADACAFPIDVDLLGLSQPIMGFDLTVTSHVNYKVHDKNGQPVVLETIDTPFTASISDAFVASERLRLANEGSIRTNIQIFFDKLRTANLKQDNVK